MVVTAIDTNVLVTLLKADRPSDIQTAQAALEQASELGALIISPVVYAELFAVPLRDEAFLTQFLQDTRISIEWRMTRAMWHRAALAYGAYAERRRGHKGDPGPRRILADFLIGAHASELGVRLLTFDSGLYKSAFPELEVILL